MKIVVHNQSEMDAIPEDYEGEIYIESGDYSIIVTKSYYQPVCVGKESKVQALGHSVIKAYDNSVVKAFNYSSVVAFNNSHIEAYDYSFIVAGDFSTINAYSDSRVITEGMNLINAYDRSSIDAGSGSRVIARHQSSVISWDNTYIEVRGDSSVRAHDYSFVKAFDRSIVEAYGDSLVVEESKDSSIVLNSHARIVNTLQNTQDFFDYYNVKHDAETAILYKAVRKTSDGKYVSDHDVKFEYVIGERKKEKCDTNIDERCSYGIHLSTLRWALEYGSSWEDLAILELETKISDIVVPKDTDGKVRTSEVKVLREVPLEECGLLGKLILDERRNRYYDF